VTPVWALAALWLGLALVATLLAIWLRVSTALSEIIVGIVAQVAIGAALGQGALGAKAPWITFLSGTGAIVLTFLAGAELDPRVFRTQLKAAGALGVAAFVVPFLGCTALAYWGLHWPARSAWLCGIALSTTSVAVVYAVMLELGLNKTDYGKMLLAACFINDLGTVLALGIAFAPFTWRTAVFGIGSITVLAVLPWATPRFFKKYGGRVSELEAKYLLLLLFGLGALATWADSEAVLPAYVIGMVLAGTVGKDHTLVRRLRTLTFGLLTPFYFIRAGSFVSVSALIAAPLVLLVLLGAKMAAKIVAVVPTSRALGYARKETLYSTMLMSTGLTFGTISALFGLSHGIIDDKKYSYLVGTVILSAIIPTVIGNAFFLPRHLLPKHEPEPAEGASEPGAQPQGALAKEAT
jgi:glutathione-regulated potassium-efflux system ancillary protein KefC